MKETRQNAEDAARRFAAAVSGAIEGFVTAFEEHDVVNEAKRGVHNAGEVARAATEETRNVAQTPEMQDLGRGLHKLGGATAGAAHTAGSAIGSTAGNAADAVRSTAHDAADGIRGTATSAKDAVIGAKDRVAHSAHQAADNVRHTVDGVKDRIDIVTQEVKVRAEAVAETGRRARVAPGRIAHELREGYRAWMRGLVTAIAMGIVMGVFGIITLIVLTIALVVGLNELVGDPAGTWIVTALYALVIVGAYFFMKTRREAASRETARRVENSRAEVRNVTAPVRSAFKGRGRAGS